MKQVNTRAVWIDNVRVIATVAVIMVHVATPVVFSGYKPQGAGNAGWWVGNVYDSLSRFCVPVFIMLSGTLLLPQQISFGEFIRKRLNRILLPFLFWSAIYLAFNLALKVRDQGAGASHNIGAWLLSQITQGTAPHLWYVYMIIGLYLFIPIIQPWVNAADNKAIVYFLSIWFILMVLNQFHIWPANTPLDLRYFGGYLGYLVLGYYLSERIIITKSIRKVGVILVVLGFVATLTGTFIYTKDQEFFSHAFYEYLTFNVFCSATGIYILVKGLTSYQGNGFLSHIRTLVSRYGYGIYLSHLLVLSIVTHFKIDYNLITPLMGIPITTFICLALSTTLTYLINKLPYGKYISG
jgi:surface polysaccharide O-acyltransferase-like enzyme